MNQTPMHEELVPRSERLRRPFWMPAILAAIVLAPALRAAEPPAEEILDKFIEATGGRAARERIQNRVVNGIFDARTAHIAGPVSIYEAKGGKYYSMWEPPNMAYEQGSNGRVLWERTPGRGLRILTGAERAFQERHSVMHADLRWKDFYSKAENVGLEKVDTSTCYKLLMTPKETTWGPETWYVDRETYYIVRTTFSIRNAAGPATMESYYGDFKKVDGVVTPHRVRQTIGTMEQVMTVQSVEHNVKLPPDRFDLPEDLKKAEKTGQSQPSAPATPSTRPSRSN